MTSTIWVVKVFRESLGVCAKVNTADVLLVS